MYKAVVTGPTGAVGTALCKKLIEENVKVYAVCREDSQRTDNIPSDAEKVFCDISRLSELPAAVGSADVFYHLAWADTFGAGRNNMYSQTDNIRYSLDAVNAAESLGCECFIGAGSQAEYGRHNSLLTPDTPCFPENGYGAAKLCAGNMTRMICSSRGIRHVWARILSVYGPYDGSGTLISYLINLLADGKSPELTAGEQLWDYIFSYDAAEALYLMWKKGRGGAVYPVGSGNVRPLREYITEIGNMISPGVPLGFGKKEYSPGQVMFLGADITSLQEELGFSPKYSFIEGIEITYEYYKSRRSK